MGAPNEVPNRSNVAAHNEPVETAFAFAIIGAHKSPFLEPFAVADRTHRGAVAAHGSADPQT